MLGTLLAAALLEAGLSREADASNEEGVKQRAASLFSDITRREARRMRRGMGVLATIGSASPFSNADQVNPSIGLRPCLAFSTASSATLSTIQWKFSSPTE